MPWNGAAPSQTFGRTDGTRTGATTWQEADAAGVDIISSAHDTHDQDEADGINACLKKDGGNTATSNLPMGGFRHTNAGAAVAATDYARFSDLQNGKGIYVPTVGGTANAITLTTGYSLSAYAAGQRFTFIAAFSNSAATTVAVDGLTAKNTTGPAATPLSSGQILAAAMTSIEYDGTQFQILTAAAVPAAIAVGFIAAWPMTTVPTGWLECDGSAVSRSTYSALFAVYSTAYGVGDGSTTFNLPNFKDYFLRGFDASGTDAASRTDRGDGTTGASVGTKQASDYLAHTHTFSATSSSDGLHGHPYRVSPDVGDANTIGGFVTDSDASNATKSAFTGTVSDSDGEQIGGAGTHTHTISGTTGTAPTSVGNETRPKNITVKWCCLALPAAALAIGTGFTRSARLIHTGDIPPQVSTDGTDATPVATEVYIGEVFVPGPGSVTITGVANFNGSVASGNLKVGLADSAGSIVATSASTAMSGTDAYQRVPFTATYAAVGPATYYVLLFIDNATARTNTHTFGNFGAAKQTAQTYSTGFTTITPPTTFTTALGPIASLY